MCDAGLSQEDQIVYQYTSIESLHLSSTCLENFIFIFFLFLLLLSFPIITSFSYHSLFSFLKKY